MPKVLTVRTALLAAMALSAACTVKETPAPPLTGPSEFSLSLTLAALPDLLTRDGFSQADIVVTARDPNGAPVRSLQVRLDMLVNGVLQDFGSLSSKTLFTGGDGRAVATYTAPPAPPPGASASTNWITIIASPVGSNQQATSSGIFGQSTSVDIRLVLPNTNTPGAPVAFFTYYPGFPAPGDLVAFDASASYPVTGSTIVNYAWSWGDGAIDGTNALPSEDHDFAAPGNYAVTLTVTDNLGQRGSTTQVVSVN